MKKTLFIFSIALLAAAPACTTTPITKCRSLALVPESQLNDLGTQAYADLKKETPLSNDAALVKVVERVGRRIAAASGANYEWEFALFKDAKMANAFCLPGGKIGVYTGILSVAKSEAGLAAILGHEVAHATAKHSQERMSQALLSQAGLAVASFSLGDSNSKGLVLAALGLGAQVGVLLPFSRKHETEADDIGLTYMAKAGYHPREAVELWKRMATQEKQAPPQFLSTHPLSKNRVTAIEARLDDVMPFYARSDKQPSGRLRF